MDELVGAQGSSLAILSLFSHGNEGLERVPDLPAVIMLVNKAQFSLFLSQYQFVSTAPLRI